VAERDGFELAQLKAQSLNALLACAKENEAECVTHHRNEQNSARRSGDERLRDQSYLAGAPGLEPGTC